ncbi:chemotaxis protein MotC [Affinirhizobium pseudoryzae]|uniref:chemotaxis protein MotC n=1 Tax=Allorhizobium pseudoryzae TaxID=379684 RepID=UPI0013ECE569|nr:chemotaxis protein MotC [Allorhizobium pseudoryzae]
MKRGFLQRLFLTTTAICSLCVAGDRARAQQTGETLEPYQMIRSLQYVQDTVVMGDHSAGEMQRFMLSSLDKRLRNINPKVFEDPRNVDAALIYAMSGGNPATLEFLVARDVGGNFDTRVGDVLRKYLAGRGLMVAKTLTAMVPEYQNQRIGPYLALVAGNVMVAKDSNEALRFYSAARLAAPGTIIEEAALRRSVAIAVEKGMPEQGIRFARQYARRFIHSPYASQFADLFVDLVVKHYGVISQEDVDGALEVMSDDRAQAIYLRIARQATIDGKTDLAREASLRAKQRGGDAQTPGSSVAKLYGGVANLSAGEIGKAAEVIEAVSDDQLSAQDRAIRAAAQRVAEEVMRPPSNVSLEQVSPDTVANQISAEKTSALPAHDATGTPAAAAAASASATPLDSEVKSFIDKGRSSLSAVDDLLKKDK